MRKIFTVRAVWDEEAGVYYSDSDISGLHIEAENLEDFERDLFDAAAELIVANHMTRRLSSARRRARMSFRPFSTSTRRSARQPEAVPHDFYAEVTKELRRLGYLSRAKASWAREMWRMRTVA